MDICQGDLGENTGEGIGENVDDDAEEGILAGDVCVGDIGGDFNGDGRNQRLVMNVFKAECHDKVREIEAFVAEHEGGGLTFNKLGKLEKLNTALEEQWSSMEAAWNEAMVNIEDGSVFMELEGLVTIAGEAIGNILRTSGLFIGKNWARVPDADASPVDAMPAVVPEAVDEACEIREGPVLEHFDPELPI